MIRVMVLGIVSVFVMVSVVVVLVSMIKVSWLVMLNNSWFGICMFSNCIVVVCWLVRVLLIRF